MKRSMERIAKWNWDRIIWISTSIAFVSLLGGAARMVYLDNNLPLYELVVSIIGGSQLFIVALIYANYIAKHEDNDNRTEMP